MLRILQNNEVILRKKEPFLTRSMLVGLLLALALHGSFLALFRIHSETEKEREVFIHPTQVEIDLGTHKPLVSIPLHSVSYPFQSLALPQLIELPFSLFSEPPPFLDTLTQDPDFSEIEEIKTNNFFNFYEDI